MSKLQIRPLNDIQRRQALLSFDDLLKSSVHESQWQQFFDTYPNILCNSLSLQVTGFYNQVRLFSGQPDYVFYHSTGQNTGDYGVIELKRSDSSIVGVYSSKHVIPSAKLTAAQFQAQRYLDSIQKGDFLNTNEFFVAGNRRQAFIIIGNSFEISKKCHSELLQLQFRNLLPPGFNLYTYDEVFRIFESSVPPQVQVLFASTISKKIEAKIMKVVVSYAGGIHVRPAMMLVDRSSRFKASITISNGDINVDAKSIMQMSMIEAKQGTSLTLISEGTDAKDALNAILEIDYDGHKLFEITEPPYDYDSNQVLKI